MASLTIITLTLNEEKNIGSCLEGVRWADQIIVVDSCSTDQTVAIAEKLSAEVFKKPWEGYGQAKNFALEHARGDWVLWLDADERVTPELAAEIRGIISRPSHEAVAYDVARRAYFLGKWIKHCGWYPGRVVRLFRRDSARFSEARVHEQLLVEGTVGHLKNDLIHYTDNDLVHYFSKFNRYTSLAAEEMLAAGKRAGIFDLLLRPLFMFIKTYVLRLGVLDGIHGFILSAVSSAYVFVKYAKLWEISRPSK